MSQKWVVFIELTDDKACVQGIQPFDETSIREKFEEFKKELPSGVTLKIRGLTGPFAEYGKAAGAR